MTLTTTFVNKTTVAFTLKEGDDGVFKEMGLLEDVNAVNPEKSRMTLEFDPKSTYREYRVVEYRVRTTGTSSTPRSSGRVAPVRILISSDFVMDNGTIYIEPSTDNPHNFVITGDPRPHGLRLSDLWVVTKILKLFKRDSNSQ